MTEQISMFGKSAKQQMIERQLKTGSGFENGKIRIYNFYFTKPLISEFAKFLQKEYGTGGYYDGKDHQDHNSKGIYMSEGINSPEVTASLTWEEVASEISKLIERGDYL